MYYPRVRIKNKTSIENDYYKQKEFVHIGYYNRKKIYIRCNKNEIDFIIDGYCNKKRALNAGKVLYSNVLYNCFYEFYNYDTGNDYFSIDNHFVNDSDFYDHNLGLRIIKASSLENIYNRPSILIGDMSIVDHDKIGAIEKIRSINTDLDYNDDNRYIYHILYLIENAEESIKTLLLFQILEFMGDDISKSPEVIEVVEKLKNYLNELNKLTESDKNSLISILDQCKNISSRKKIHNLINKYNHNHYSKFDKNKLIEEMYTIRSNIIHGNIIIYNNDLIQNNLYLKLLVLDTFYKWAISQSKENE